MNPKRDADRVNEMLKAMEGNFLAVLAEHQRETEWNEPSPKEWGAGPASSAGSAPHTDVPDTVVATVMSKRETLDVFVDAMAHWYDHRCLDGAETLISLATRVLRTLIAEGVDKGWYDSLFPEGGTDGEAKGED